MKITHINEHGDMMVVLTNDPKNPEFVYKKDRFYTYDALEREILLKCKQKKEKKEKKQGRFDKVKSEWEEK